MLQQAQNRLKDRSDDHVGELLRIMELGESVLSNVCLKGPADWSPSDFAKVSQYCFIIRGLSENLCSGFNQYSRMANAPFPPSLKRGVAA